MTYHVLNVYDMLNDLGESMVQEMLSSFSCPLNPEIERFVRERAIEFTKSGTAITYLVFVQDEVDATFNLVGVYTLTYKVMQIPQEAVSGTVSRKLARCGEYDLATCTYTLPAPLIAQFGKNYTDDFNLKITGEALMNLAFDQIAVIHSLAGGRVCCLECEDNPKVLNFYYNQGFRRFACRSTDGEENNLQYHQLIKIMR